MNDLYVVADWLTAEQEADILAAIPKGVYMQMGCSIVRYGSSRPYNSFVVSKVIPPYLEALAQRVADEGHMARPTSVTVKEYKAGKTPMLTHTDTGGPAVCCLSLFGAATFVFTREGREPVRKEAPPRALLRFGGEWNRDWQHNLDPLAGQRYSLVFRTED